MKIKEIINDRNSNYTQILKTELVYAKNIIKNPQLFKQLNRDMNNKVNNLSVYQIGNKKARNKTSCGTHSLKVNTNKSRQRNLTHSIDLSIPPKTAFIPFVGDSRTNQSFVNKNMHQSIVISNRNVFTPEIHLKGLGQTKSKDARTIKSRCLSPTEFS